MCVWKKWRAQGFFCLLGTYRSKHLQNLRGVRRGVYYAQIELKSCKSSVSRFARTPKKKKKKKTETFFAVTHLKHKQRAPPCICSPASRISTCRSSSRFVKREGQRREWMWEWVGEWASISLSNVYVCVCVCVFEEDTQHKIWGVWTLGEWASACSVCLVLQWGVFEKGAYVAADRQCGWRDIEIGTCACPHSGTHLHLWWWCVCVCMKRGLCDLILRWCDHRVEMGACLSEFDVISHSPSFHSQHLFLTHTNTYTQLGAWEDGGVHPPRAVAREHGHPGPRQPGALGFAADGAWHEAGADAAAHCEPLGHSGENVCERERDEVCVGGCGRRTCVSSWGRQHGKNFHFPVNVGQTPRCATVMCAWYGKVGVCVCEGVGEWGVGNGEMRERGWRVSEGCVSQMTAPSEKPLSLEACCWNSSISSTFCAVSGCQQTTRNTTLQCKVYFITRCGVL